MTPAAIISLVAVVVTIGGIIYNAGRTLEAQSQAKRQADGLGTKVRELDMKQDRRFDLLKALLVEWAAGDAEKSKLVADFIREE